MLLDPEKIRFLEPSFVIDMRTFPNFSTTSANIVESGNNHGYVDLISQPMQSLHLLHICNIYILGELTLDDEGNFDKKENLIVANEELATENHSILSISNTFANFFECQSL